MSFSRQRYETLLVLSTLFPYLHFIVEIKNKVYGLVSRLDAWPVDKDSVT